MVPSMIILRRLWCSPCPIRTSNGWFLCFECVVTIGGRFRSVFRGFPFLSHDSSRHSGKSFLSPWSLCWHDCYAIPPFHAIVTYSHAQFHHFLPVVSAVSLSVRRTRPAWTDFHHVCASCGPDCLNYRLYSMLSSGLENWFLRAATFQRSRQSPLFTFSHCGPSFCCLIRRSGHILLAHPFFRSFVSWILAFFHDYFLLADFLPAASKFWCSHHGSSRTFLALHEHFVETFIPKRSIMNWCSSHDCWKPGSVRPWRAVTSRAGNNVLLSEMDCK